MIAPEQRHAARGITVEQELVVVGVVPPGLPLHAPPGRPVGQAKGIEQPRAFLEPAIGDDTAHRPVAARLPRQLAKGGLVDGVPIGPVGRGRSRAGVIDPRPVRIGQRQRAPKHPARTIVLSRIAERRGQRRGHVPGEQPRHHVAIDVVIVEIAVALLMRADHARPQRTVRRQRPRDIAFQPPHVERAEIGRAIGLEAGRRPLAQEVDRRGRIADPGHDRVRTAHRLDPVEQHGVQVAGLDAVE